MEEVNEPTYYTLYHEGWRKGASDRAREHNKRTGKQIQRNRANRYRLRLREQVFHLLNQHWCQRCPEFDKRCLQFDHINGDGSRMNYGVGSKYAFYLVDPDWTRRNIQVLCANCNWKKRFERDESGKRPRE